MVRYLMKDELESILKEAVVAYSWYCSGICFTGLQFKNIAQSNLISLEAYFYTFQL
jgi:hypothetical protein